jgi:hypothetical protein
MSVWQYFRQKAVLHMAVCALQEVHAWQLKCPYAANIVGIVQQVQVTLCRLAGRAR